MFFLTKMMPDSRLTNQDNFYVNFVQDLRNCSKDVVIESPFITSTRMEFFYPIFEELIARNVRIHIITRDPIEHDDEYMRDQATNEILQTTELGVKVIMLKGFHHRKLAIIDRKILWEGSLNILSYSKSKELMRRINDADQVKQMISFLNLHEYI